MTSEVSREKPIDYALMAQLLIEERERGGYPIWVHGAGAGALARAQRHDAGSSRNGFVGALLAGNAVAVHDIEASIFGTTLGMTRQRRGDAAAGTGCTCARSTRCAPRARSRTAVEQGIITDGIMHACVMHDVPFVLTGSIRDDGPLPGRDHRHDRRRRTR